MCDKRAYLCCGASGEPAEWKALVDPDCPRFDVSMARMCIRIANAVYEDLVDNDTFLSMLTDTDEVPMESFETFDGRDPASGSTRAVPTVGELTARICGLRVL